VASNSTLINKASCVTKVLGIVLAQATRSQGKGANRKRMHRTGTLSLEDLPHEEDVLRNPYSLKSWWRYLEFKEDASPNIRYLLYERALKELPGSYKLWWSYLSERMRNVKTKCLTHPGYAALNNAFERALVYMHKVTHFAPQGKIQTSLIVFFRCLSYGLPTVPFCRNKNSSHARGRLWIELCELCPLRSMNESGLSTFHG